ncbi:hypothetical protein PENSPDRAFT_655484 [Peniophora sp. CONT]|nr:hypothetical protein PENSPDRAFT_655484 [Peniophora sp. CONT]
MISTSPDHIRPGGVQRNTRPQRRNDPYFNQAAASGADLTNNNMISTGAAPTGGARSNGAGRTTLSPPRTTTRKASQTAKKSSTTAEGPKWMCKVAKCPGKRCKERGPNNEPLFVSKQGFENHMKTHARDSMAATGSKSAGDSDAGKGSVPVEGWKPEICPDCGKKLDSGRKDSLKRHIKTACKGKKDAEKKDASAPDEHPSDLHKHNNGDEDDDQGFGGMGGMPKGMPQQWASGQAGPSIW